MRSACYSVRNTRRTEALGSRKDTVVWTEYLRSQNSGQWGTIQELRRKDGRRWSQLWHFQYFIASKRRRQKLTQQEWE